MIRRVLRLLLSVVLVGSVFLVLPAAGAQAACDVTVSSTSVLVGESITITGLNFKGGTPASLLVDGTPVHNGTTDRNGVIATTHSFGAPGTYLVWGTGTDLGSNPCTTARRQVQVNAPAPTTTTAPPTTTTTTTTIPDFGILSIVSGECLVEFSFGMGGHVVSPGQVIPVQGSGFESDLPVFITLVGYELTVVSPDADGEFMTEVTVPDWPEASYGMKARQPKSGADWCSGDVEIQIDREPDAELGDCSISLAQMKLGLGFPWSAIYPVYVTYGYGFEPGEVVVVTVEGGFPWVEGTVQLGDFTEVSADGTFVMVGAPPSEWLPDEGTVEVWARSNTCTAKATLGEPEPVRAELPSFTVTPDVLRGAGIYLYPGSCELVVWKETGISVNEVDPAYQNYPLDENFINAYGEGFVAGEDVTWLLDGQVMTFGSYSTTVDGAGKFYASGGNVLNPLQTADQPFILTAQTESCTTSAQYGAFLAAGIDPVLPESAAGPGAALGDGPCQLVVWKGDGQEHPNVPSAYQEPLVDEGYFNAFGTGFVPNGEVRLFLDGLPNNVVGDGLPQVDAQGNFHATAPVTGGYMHVFEATDPPFLVTAVDYDETCRASAAYGPFAIARAPVLEGSPMVPEVALDSGPVGGESTPVSLPPHDCETTVWRGFPYFSDDPGAMPDPPPGVPLEQWAYAVPDEMYVWGFGFTPGEIVEGQIDGQPVDLAISPSWPPGVTETVHGDGTIGRFAIVNYNSDWFQGAYCSFPCQFTLDVLTPSCNASTYYSELDPADFEVAIPELIEDTIPIPGSPGDDVVQPGNGLLPDDLSPAGMAVLVLVGLGGAVGGFLGGGALAGRGGFQPPPDDMMPGATPPPDDNMPGAFRPPPDDGLPSAQPPPDDQMPGAQPPPDDSLPSPGHGGSEAGIIDDNLPSPGHEGVAPPDDQIPGGQV